MIDLIAIRQIYYNRPIVSLYSGTVNDLRAVQVGFPTMRAAQAYIDDKNRHPNKEYQIARVIINCEKDKRWKKWLENE